MQISVQTLFHCTTIHSDQHTSRNEGLQHGIYLKDYMYVFAFYGREGISLLKCALEKHVQVQDTCGTTATCKLTDKQPEEEGHQSISSSRAFRGEFEPPPPNKICRKHWLHLPAVVE